MYTHLRPRRFSSLFSYRFYQQRGPHPWTSTLCVTTEQFQWALSSVGQSGGWPFWLLPPSWCACSRLVASSAISAAQPQILLPLLPLLVTAQPKRRPRHSLPLQALLLALLPLPLGVSPPLLRTVVLIMARRRLWPLRHLTPVLSTSILK